MSTRCSVYCEGPYHLWSEAMEGKKYGLLLSGYQEEDDNVDQMDFERIRIPLEICAAIHDWYAKVKK